MKISLFKFVLPIDKKVFRLHILKCISFQILLATIVYIVLQNRETNIQFFDGFDDYYVAWIVNLFMLTFVYDINKFRARFKDAYPDMELNRIFYYMAGFVPVFFIGLIIFLCVKESGSEVGGSYPRAFKKRYALLGVLPLLALQAQFTSVSYWTASPTSYYLLDMVKQNFTVSSFERKNPSIDILTEYAAFKSSTVGVVEIPILLGKVSAEGGKLKDRAIASGKNPMMETYQFGVDYLKACDHAIRISEDNELKVSDYSPVHWMYPSGPVEIFMTKVMDQRLREKMASQMQDHCFRVLEKLDDMQADLPVKSRGDFTNDISDLRMNFLRHRKFTESYSKN